jgi:group I intron endonuclease
VKQTGVYQIRCTVNGKVYVGSAARSIGKRWNDHRQNLRRNQHRNKHLQAAWDMYGEASFEFLILEECPSIDCIEREQFWIDAKRAAEREFGYNASPIAGSFLGSKHTEAARLLMSQKKKGGKLTKEHRQKLSEVRKGKKFTEAHREALSKSLRGKKRTEAQCRAIGDSKKGRKLSEAHCQQMSESRKGRKASEETRRKLSRAFKGRKRNPLTGQWSQAACGPVKGTENQTRFGFLREG